MDITPVYQTVNLQPHTGSIYEHCTDGSSTILYRPIIGSFFTIVNLNGLQIPTLGSGQYYGVEVFKVNRYVYGENAFGETSFVTGSSGNPFPLPIDKLAFNTMKVNCTINALGGSNFQDGNIPASTGFDADPYFVEYYNSAFSLKLNGDGGVEESRESNEGSFISFNNNDFSYGPASSTDPNSNHIGFTSIYDSTSQDFILRFYSNLFSQQFSLLIKGMFKIF
jgi:hypothetical protein